MTTRMQVTLEREQHRRAAERASALGISLAEYVRRVVDADLAGLDEPASDVREVFGIGDSGGSDVAHKKAEYLGDAISATYDRNER